MKIRTLFLPTRTRAGETTTNTCRALYSHLDLRGCQWWQEPPVSRETGGGNSVAMAHRVSVMATDHQWQAILHAAHNLFDVAELLVVTSGDGRFVTKT